MTRHDPAVTNYVASADASPSPRHRVRRFALLGIAGLLVLSALGVGGFILYGQYLFSKVHKVVIKAEQPQIAGEPINILLIGDNTRTGLSPAEASAFGTSSQVGGGRADVSMIAHFDPHTKQVTLLSIPRDLFMPIPGTTQLQRVDAELNPTSSTSSAESPNQLVKTIEDDLGIPIQHYVELNFDSFQGVVNALGGVQMYFPTELRDAYSGLNVTTTGCIKLDGYQALQVVRSRHLYYLNSSGTWSYDGLGDLSRTRRDHIFLQVLAAQVKSAGLANPVRDLALLKSVYSDLTLDSAFSESDLLSLVLTYRHANPATAVTGTLPIAYEGNNSGYLYNGANYGSIVFPQEPADTALMDQTLGMTVPSISPSSINVTVVNGSSISDQGSIVTQGLQALGYRVATASAAAPSGAPAETVIYYTPGDLAQAEALKSSLSGEIIMGEVASTGYGTPLELLAGDQLAVGTKVTVPVTTTSTPKVTSTTSNAPRTTSGPTTTRAPTTPTSLASTTVISLPNITVATQINTVQQPEPWDPRACPT